MVFNRATEWPQIIGWSGPFEGFSEPEQLLAAFFASSNVGLAVIDTQFHYLAVNQALADMNGVAVEAHLGKSMGEILGEAAGPLEPILRRVVHSGKAVMNMAVALQLPGRAELGHWVVHYFPMNDAAGKVARIGVVVVEVTQHKKLEAKLGRLAGELQQKKERLKMLLEISTTLNLTPELGQAFPSIAASIRRVLPYDWIDLSLLEESSESVRLYAMDSSLELPGLGSEAGYPLKDTLGGEAIAEGHPKIFRRAELAAIHSPLVDQMLQRGIRSAYSMPFVTPKGASGSFNLASSKERAFHSEDLDLLKQIGMQLANALDHTLAAAEIGPSGDGRKREWVKAQREMRCELDFEEIVGQSPALQRVLQQAKTVAPTDATVLIRGETGTGKELIARAIHHMSLRKERCFIKLNCAAMPGRLLESELLGHEPGAFPGAVSGKIGRLERADQGTLFLEEIGDIPLELQAKLLRVLQGQGFERLGSRRTMRVDVRLLAATNQDLANRVRAGEFRADLYYRLNVFPLRMPALGERGEDIPLLVRYFVEKSARRMNKKIESISAEAMQALTRWDWPGNIRELENFIERSVILSQGPVLHIPLAELGHPAPPSWATPEAVQREDILRALRETKGWIEGPRGAAARLGMTPANLRFTMQRMNLPRKNYQN